MGLLAALLAWGTGGSQERQLVPDRVAALPLPQTLTRLRVVVMGDQGTGTNTQRRTAAAMRSVCEQAGCELGVGLGDNFYPSAPRDPDSPLFRERFEVPYGPLKIPFLMIAGNHDHSWLTGGDGGDPAGAEAQVAYSRRNPQWVMPARTYRAPVGHLAEFFAVDTAPLAAPKTPRRAEEQPGGPWDRAQREWLDLSLRRSSARWRFVLGHHPLFSNGPHGDAGHYDDFTTPAKRGDAVQNLYRVTCGRADALLGGHDHILNVFAPQPGCPGTRQWVSGAAGQRSSARQGNRPAAAEFYGQSGFLWLDITRDRLVLRVYTVPEGTTPKLAYSETLHKGD